MTDSPLRIHSPCGTRRLHPPTTHLVCGHGSRVPPRTLLDDLHRAFGAYVVVEVGTVSDSGLLERDIRREEWKPETSSNIRSCLANWSCPPGSGVTISKLAGDKYQCFGALLLAVLVQLPSPLNSPKYDRFSCDSPQNLSLKMTSSFVVFGSTDP